ncbi:MAG: TraB/GumN family protein [Deltaproteobacteria bacterium]|nr:TraB/GumN family protein [Deltaproteobacteria bacterium]MBW2387309.1 TraB/GumN family protein [Deltaproteobacteria bacterium]
MTRWIAALLWTAAGLACATADTVSAGSGPGVELAEPILWQVDVTTEDDGQKKAGRLYLLGSIHVGPRGGWKLPAATLARFEASDALVVEVDMRAGSPEEQDDAVLRYGLLPGGESLKNHISPELYKELERYVAKIGRSMININPWKPWMVATMLLGFETERLGYPTEAGLDLDLMARVSKTQRIIGLETMAEQLSLLGDMAPEEQELMLKDMLLQAADIENYFNALKEAWRTGDEAKLEKILFSELEAAPELAPFYERVIFARNQTMCERLQKLLESGEETLFGVVGAYHLVGTRGIPACLSGRGFQVTRLSAS